MKDIKIELNASEASGEAYWRKRCDAVEAELSRLRAVNAEQAKPEPRSETCVWTPQGGAWFRDCARATSMWEAVPAVCPFCGKRIEVKK